MTARLRIGLGIDVHRLAAGRPCILGGVEIPSPVGPAGHSDGDAALHAVCDAVLGAAGLDDLGSLFPDDDPTLAGRASSGFCVDVLERTRRAGWSVQSIDIVIETEKPAIQPHRAAMRARIAALFGTEVDAVNVKGKSGEKVGPIGNGEALRATAVALLSQTREVG